MKKLSALRRIALFTLLSLLFSQMAIAAYACSSLNGAGTHIDNTGVSSAPASMPDCHTADTENPNLCMQHCQAGNQSVQSAPQLVAPLVALFVQFVVEPAPVGSGSSAIAGLSLSGRRTSPLPLTLYGALRI